MSVEITRLANGLTVVSDPMPHLESAALGVWVNCGGRQEKLEEVGLSHMLEHMAFKGTTRRTARQIAEEIEAVGGDLNAYTGREQTAFLARVLKNDVPLALDILADILLRPIFDPEELAREREVIIQELGQTLDTPDDLVFEHLQAACFPDQPMGRSILGTAESVSGFSRDDLGAYMGRNYRAGDMSLIASGAVDHDTLVKAAETLFAGLTPGSIGGFSPARFEGLDVREVSDLEQAHLTYAFSGVAADDPDAVAAQVFATALGGGMSSRLFQEAREKRGLCYSISAFVHSYRDCGVIGVYSGTSEDKAGEIAPIVAGEIAAMAEGATAQETQRARAQLKASLLMGLESPSARCEHISGHLLAFGRVLPVAEIIRRVDAVDELALRRFASRIGTSGSPAMASVGPVKRVEPLSRFAARFGALHPPATVKV